ncbi:hypothetical protein DSO57_1028326 [Entomophthora muscae]|uniref:Uncharacterized protein n=1 Tax=Entomophthora muscae TaxID=34485 RepID=A0ACC2SRA5_9FUNG|nr:hypothetical protein DSO57_1028326 [Entomophthora muscae]
MNPFYAIAATILPSTLAYPNQKPLSPIALPNLVQHGNFRKGGINPMNNLGSYDIPDDQPPNNHLNQTPQGIRPDLDLTPPTPSTTQPDKEQGDTRHRIATSACKKARQRKSTTS